MPGPRTYRSGAEKALYLLSRGTCYFPDCTEPVIRFVEDVPVTNVHISHVRGAKPGSARYDPNMTDAERAAFANLILCCFPHHQLVDRIAPERFPVELLLRWKDERESEGAGELQGLRSLTEDTLAEMLEKAFRDYAPKREVAIEVAGFYFSDPVNGYVIPISGWRKLLDANPHIVQAERAIVTTVRNVGYSPASVETCVLDFIFRDANGKEQVCTLAGANNYPLINPPLPKLLEVGAPSINWLTSLAALGTFLPALLNVGGVKIRAKARLGSGEEITSKAHSVELLPLVVG